MGRWDYEDTDPRGTKHDAEVELYESSKPCPECGQDMYQRHHQGSWKAPECWWWECNVCEYRTEPE